MSYRYRFTLTEWAKRPEVAEAYREMAKEHGLVDKELRDVDRLFSFTDAAVSAALHINFRYVYSNITLDLY
jgi:hypothetical protein